MIEKPFTDEIILLSWVRASLFCCIKLCRAPYTWLFDSEMYSSSNVVTTPHGQIPARMPIWNTMEGRLHVCYLFIRTPAIHTYLLCADLSGYVCPSQCCSSESQGHQPHLKRPCGMSIHPMSCPIDTMHCFSDNATVNLPSVGWRHNWVAWLHSWLLGWRWCGRSCYWPYRESVECLSRWLYSAVHNINCNSLLKLFNQGHRKGGCLLPCAICQWLSQPGHLLKTYTTVEQLLKRLTYV